MSLVTASNYPVQRRSALDLDLNVMAFAILKDV